MPNVYAGGDIAYAPVFFANTSAAIGHFSLAHYHGKIAAMNICKKETPLKTVPFFWTTLFGKSYRYAGTCHIVSLIIYKFIFIANLDLQKFFLKQVLELLQILKFCDHQKTLDFLPTILKTTK